MMWLIDILRYGTPLISTMFKFVHTLGFLHPYLGRGVLYRK